MQVEKDGNIECSGQGELKDFRLGQARIQGSLAGWLSRLVQCEARDDRVGGGGGQWSLLSHNCK